MHSHSVMFLCLGAVALASAVLWLAATAPALEPPPARLADAGSTPAARDESARPVVAEQAQEPLGIVRSAAAVDEPPRCVVLRGRVIDERSCPVEGATIQAISCDPRGACERLAVAVAAKDGSFAASCPARVQGQFVQLKVSHAEFCEEHVFVRLDPAVWQVAFDDITLRLGGIVRGSVIDGYGGVLAEATTTLRPLTRASLGGAQDRVVETDRSGRYVFVHVAPGRYLVEASAAHCDRRCSEILTVDDRDEVHVAPMQLGRGGLLRGAVLAADRRPIVDATVILRARQPDVGTIQSVRTGTDGRFAFEHAAVGHHSIQASAVGFQSTCDAADVFVPVTEGPPVFVFLERGLRIGGSVTEADSGMPVLDFAVSIRRTADPGGGLVAGSDVEGPELAAGWLPAMEQPCGRFEFEGLDEGTYVVEVRSRDHVDLCSGPVQVRRGETAVELVLRLQRGLRIQGSVLATADGRPVGQAEVQLRAVAEGSSHVAADAPADAGDPEPACDDARALRSRLCREVGRGSEGSPSTFGLVTRTESDGTFSMPSALGGRYVLRVQAAGYAPFTSEVFVLGRDLSGVAIRLEALGSVAGCVARAGADGTDRLLVVARSVGTAAVRVAEVDRDGGYALRGLEPGEYTVRCLAVADGDRGAWLAALAAEPSVEDSGTKVDVVPGRIVRIDLAMSMQRSTR